MTQQPSLQHQTWLDLTALCEQYASRQREILNEAAEQMLVAALRSCASGDDVLQRVRALAAARSSGSKTSRA